MIYSFYFFFAESLEAVLPIPWFLTIKLLPVNDRLPVRMENGIVAIAHVFLPCQFCKGWVLFLTYMVQLVWVTVAVAWRPSFAYQVGVVIVLPLVPVSKFLLQPFLSAVECPPINIRPDKSCPSTNTTLHKPRLDINIRLLTRVEEAHDGIRPPRALLDFLLKVVHVLL